MNRRGVITPSWIARQRRRREREPLSRRRAVWDGPTMEDRFKRAMLGEETHDGSLTPLCRMQRRRTLANGGHPVR